MRYPEKLVNMTKKRTSEQYMAFRYGPDGRIIYLDRWIMNATVERHAQLASSTKLNSKDDEVVIHLNGDELDCRRENMRLEETEC
jgi:hypothetical protein